MVDPSSNFALCVAFPNAVLFVVRISNKQVSSPSHASLVFATSSGVLLLTKSSKKLGTKSDLRLFCDGSVNIDSSALTSPTIQESNTVHYFGSMLQEYLGCVNIIYIHTYIYK